MKFEKMFKKDFIAHIIMHNDLSEKKAKKIWKKYGKDYIENMYQIMSDDIAWSVMDYEKKAIAGKDITHEELVEELQALWKQIGEGRYE